LVVIGMKDGGVVVTIRVDLDPAVADPGAVEHSVAAMRRGGAERFIGVIFDDLAQPAEGAEALPWSGLISELMMTVMGLDGDPADAFLVAGGRYWSYVCFGAGCCPDEGTPVSAATSEVPARATYAGMVALPDRESVGRILDPLPEPERERLRPMIESAIAQSSFDKTVGEPGRLDRSDIRALFAAARKAPVHGAHELGDRLTARYAAALQRIDVRDSVWVAIDDGRLPDDTLWRHLALVLPAPYSAPPLFLIGWAAWRQGHGAFALMAAERALAADPGYTAADLLLAALTNGVDPRAMPRIRRPARKYGPTRDGQG